MELPYIILEKIVNLSLSTTVLDMNNKHNGADTSIMLGRYMSGNFFIYITDNIFGNKKQLAMKA